MESVQIGKREVEGDLVRHSLCPSFLCSTELNVGIMVFIRYDLHKDDSGSLDREAFVQGMWRIDEELRKQRNKPSFTLHLRSPPTRTTTLLL